jgi:hypothetical protein
MAIWDVCEASTAGAPQTLRRFVIRCCQNNAKSDPKAAN